MKGSIVCRVLLCLLSLFRPDSLMAQVWDDFSDGDITNGVVWTGDTGAFTVNSGVLKLNNTGSDSSYLVTALSSVNDTMEWSVRVRLNFAPSSLNYLRVYLSSTQQDLKSALDGYFLQFGETGSSDAIVFCRQNSYQVTSVFRSRDSIVAQPFEFYCKVVRYPGGQWELLTDTDSDGSFFTEGNFTDNTLQPSQFTGFKCVYTSTNATNFTFDDYYAGAYRRDTIPPSVAGAVLESDSTLLVNFSEPMDTPSLLNMLHYTLNGSLVPSQVIITDPSHIQVLLLFATSLQQWIAPELCIQGTSDESGNLINGMACVPVFRFDTATAGDILFSEVMYDPTNSPSLPEVEYVEIYNRTNHSVLLNGWEFSDPSSSASILQDTIHPGAYRVYCDLSLLPLMNAAGVQHVKGLSGFPSLNNTGDYLELRNQSGQLINALNYTPEMYRDPLRDDHGWSLERIDVTFACHDFFNWKASADPSGGSPGYQNPSNGTFEDTIAPWAVHVFPMDSIHLLVAFSEYPDSGTFNPATMLEIIGFPGVINGFYWDPQEPQVTLTLSDPLQGAAVYTLRVDQQFTDCAGNPLSRWDRLDFQLPSDSGMKDIRLSEILFNPYPDGSDFVEVYNSGSLPIDLSRLRLAHADLFTGQAQDVIPFTAAPRLLMPGRYAAATTDIADIRKRYIVSDLRTLMPAGLPSYNDDEGIVVLMEPSLQEIERYHYRELHHFPLINDPEGVSLERVSMLRPAPDSTSWHSAAENAGFATPGAPNSQRVETATGNQWLSVNPVLITPDNDGYHDVQQIFCVPSHSGFVAHLQILNAQGVPVRTLARQELMGDAGTWIWDGTDDTGQPLIPGIYIVLAELFHIDGETRKFKTAAVIAEQTHHGN